MLMYIYQLYTSAILLGFCESRGVE